MYISVWMHCAFLFQWQRNIFLFFKIQIYVGLRNRFSKPIGWNCWYKLGKAVDGWQTYRQWPISNLSAWKNGITTNDCWTYAAQCAARFDIATHGTYSIQILFAMRLFSCGSMSRILEQEIRLTAIYVRLNEPHFGTRDEIDGMGNKSFIFSLNAGTRRWKHHVQATT